MTPITLPRWGKTSAPQFPTTPALSCGHQHLRNTCEDCGLRLCGPCSRADSGWALHCGPCWSSYQEQGRGE